MLIFIYRLSVHKPNRGSRKKVRLRTRQGQRGKKKENWGAKRRKEAITERRTNRCKGPGLGDTNTGKKKIMAIRRKEEQREGYSSMYLGAEPCGSPALGAPLISGVNLV